VSEELVLPYSGQLVQFTEPDQCLQALAEIRELERKLRDAKSELTYYLTEEFKRQGTKTMHFGNVTGELKGGTELAWDLEVLDELRALGLPEERFNQLVHAEVTYKVSQLEAKRIAAANPDYAEVIERARRVYPKAQYVSVKRSS